MIDRSKDIGFFDGHGEINKIKDSRAREVLTERFKEIEGLPNQQSQEIGEIKNWLSLLISHAVGGEDMFTGKNEKFLIDLSEVIERMKEGNIEGARALLFDRPEEIKHLQE